MIRVALAGLLLPTLAQAGAWTRPPGEVFAQASLYTIAGAQAFQLKGDLGLRDVPTYTENSLQLYTEVGLINGLTAVVAIDALRRFSVGEDDNLGLADSQAGLRVALPLGFPLAFEALAVLPTSRVSDDAEGRLPLGYGEWGGDLRLSLGHAFGGSGWITGDAGVRLLTGNVPPTLVTTLGGGWRPTERILLEIVFRGFHPLADPEEAVPEDQYANRDDTRYVGYGLHLGFRLPADVWLGGGVEGGNGHEVANAPNLKLSVWRTF